jgi:hypothetical protein
VALGNIARISGRMGPLGPPADTAQRGGGYM